MALGTLPACPLPVQTFPFPFCCACGCTAELAAVIVSILFENNSAHNAGSFAAMRDAWINVYQNRTQKKERQSWSTPRAKYTIKPIERMKTANGSILDVWLESGRCGNNAPTDVRLAMCIRL